MIVDDSDPGFSVTGEWAIGGGPGIGRDGNVHLEFGESFLPKSVAAWNFNLPGPGRYRVSATWYTNPFFNTLWSQSAAYEVSDGSTALGAPLLNQQNVPNDFNDAGSAWEDVGVFDITSSTLNLRLFTGSDDKYVIADAIRVVKIGDLSPTAEVHVTMAGETGHPSVDVPDGSTGIADFGTTDFHESVEKTFTISNRGTAPLDLFPLTITPGSFSLESPPADRLDPGQSTTFVIRMHGEATGARTATVSFGNSDGDEGPFDFQVSGAVRTTNIIDDGDPGSSISPLPVEPGGWGQIGGPGREFDYKYNRNLGVEAVASWTFNVTPGRYRVSTTWAFGFSGFDDQAPFSIYDGADFVGGRNIDQQLDPDDADYPDGFMFPPGTSGATKWERIGDVIIHGGTLTVKLHAVDPIQFVLADSILIDRLGDLVGPLSAAEPTVDEISALEAIDLALTDWV
jgi:hypothetical protein